jgi:hypothetical protein
MILMGNLPFRVAFEDSTQHSCKCQLFLLFDDAGPLCEKPTENRLPATQTAIISPLDDSRRGSRFVARDGDLHEHFGKYGVEAAITPREQCPPSSS